MSALAIVPPGKDICASIHIGGSKSISNRILILKEVLQQNFTIQNISDSEDTQLLLEILLQLKKGENFEFNVNHAGTNLRFLTAFLAAKPGGTYTLTGSARLKERPIKDLVNALTALGAEIHYLEKSGYPPLKIKGKILKGGKVHVMADVSSQFVSALLLISPLLSQGLEIFLDGAVVSLPYIQLSISLLEHFGIKCDFQDNRIKVIQPKEKTNFPGVFKVESDWSSASYWFSICALSKNSKITLSTFDEKSGQADARLPEIYAELGVKTEYKAGEISLSHIPAKCQTFIYNFNDCPDIAPTLAATCAGLGIKANLSGLKTLQLKESKRLDVLKSELEKFGANVNINHDSLEIIPPVKKTTKAIHIMSQNDHRMAMCFAPLSLIHPKIIIENPDVVNKSYPLFWKDLQSLGFRLNLHP